MPYLFFWILSGGGFSFNNSNNTMTSGIRGSQILLIVALFIITSLVAVAINAGLLAVTISGINKQKITISQALKVVKKYFVKYLVTVIYVGAASIASLLLFIIPFFFVFPRLILAPYFTIDKGLEPVDAIKASWEKTSGNVSKVYGILVASVVMFLPAFTILGIPFAIYFIFMFSAATGVLYNFLANKE